MPSTKNAPSVEPDPPAATDSPEQAAGQGDATEAAPVDTRAPAAPRCDARDEENRQCLYEMHSDSFPHLFEPPISKDAEPEIAAARRNAGKKFKVIRSTANAWWCPKCDNAQQSDDNRVCHNCGAIPLFGG